MRRRAATFCWWFSITAGFVAAGLWAWSAMAPLPLSPGATIGATLPSDPFNVALAQSARFNAWGGRDHRSLRCISSVGTFVWREDRRVTGPFFASVTKVKARPVPEHLEGSCRLLRHAAKFILKNDGNSPKPEN